MPKKTTGRSPENKPALISRGGTTVKATFVLDETLLLAAKGVAGLKSISTSELVREAIRGYVLHHAGLIRQELEILDGAARLARLEKQALEKEHKRRQTDHDQSASEEKNP